MVREEYALNGPEWIERRMEVYLRTINAIKVGAGTRNNVDAIKDMMRGYTHFRDVLIKFGKDVSKLPKKLRINL